MMHKYFLLAYTNLGLCFLILLVLVGVLIQVSQ